MEILEKVDLKPYNTFGIAATADEMYDCYDEMDVHEATKLTMDKPRYVLSGGSNTLFLGDYHGAIIRPLIGGVDIKLSDFNDTFVRVGAGVVWDDFVRWSIENGLYGIENLSGIPGLVGASPVQNIGAYGVEAKDAIFSVEGVWADEPGMFDLSAKECKFGYRDSIFKHELKGRGVITHVTFRLKNKPDYKLGYGAISQKIAERGAEPTAALIREVVKEIRDSKLPNPAVMGNAGSFFKNPEVSAEVAEAIRKEFPTMPSYDLPSGLVKIPAGWLIEQSGMKGASIGPAAVHDKQALVIVNKGGATGADIVAMSDAVRGKVKEKFGIDITPEVNFV